MLITERFDHTRFSNSEQIIVDYLKREQLNIESKSTTQIAAETYSSKSTIVSVAKKMDFHGWNDFKKAYLDELRYLANHTGTVDANYPFGPHDHFIGIAQKIARLEQEAIADTLALQNFQDLQKAVTLLTRAEAIHIFAVSNNLLISEEFRYNMERIKKRVLVHARQGEGRYAATLVDPNECALIISYSGETETLMNMVRILHERQIPLLLITSVGENSMSHLADCVLHISTREKLYSKIATFSNDASITYLLDVLYSCVFQQQYDRNVDLRRETSQIFESGRHSSVKFLRESSANDEAFPQE